VLTIGLLQVLALFPGIRRAGITMVGGLWSGSITKTPRASGS
jgi:undecaprenyl pyrophosphate phosphatase UppP